MSDRIQWRRSVEPASEPVTLTQAKKQLEIASGDTTHDTHLGELIEAARDQVEHDTGLALVTQTIEQWFHDFDECVDLVRRPIQSVTSIVYYDTSNTIQTLSSSVYSLNASCQRIELAYNQIWPSTVDRWDAVKVTYVAGFETSPDDLIPKPLKQAMLLLIGYNFENRDQFTNYKPDAYEALVRRYMRATYP